MKDMRLEMGDICWIKFSGENHIQNGVRPAIIIQNNKGNVFSPTVQVVPLTSRLNKTKLPTHAIIENTAMTGLSRKSIAQCEGIRIVGKNDILGKIGKVDKKAMKEVSKCLLINMPLLLFFTKEELLRLQTKMIKTN